jgi:uncharacterized membrane protein YkvA (DUF1232 family)
VLRGLLIAIAVALALWLLAIAILLVLGRRSQARELATLIPNLVVLFRGLLGDPRVPRGSKAWMWFALAWFVSPIDLIPEFLPVVGPLDDAIVAALVLRYVLRRTDRAVLVEHWRGDRSTLDAILGSERRKRSVERAAAESERDETHGGSIWRSGKGGSHIG